MLQTCDDVSHDDHHHDDHNDLTFRDGCNPSNAIGEKNSSMKVGRGMKGGKILSMRVRKKGIERLENQRYQVRRERERK